MTTAIVAQGLSRSFGDVEAVRRLDLEVVEGTVFGFLGPNGAGKTTTVRMLTTLLRPSAGSATVAGHDVTGDPRAVRRSIGAALQDSGLDGLATGRELLELHGRLQRIARRDVRDRASELLEMNGLAEAGDRQVKTYSGGMRRKLDLAIALVHRPAVLFLDEPTAGLDPPSRMALWDEIRRLRDDDGLTVFLTTQYLEEADRLADTLAIIAGGSIIAEGTPGELKASVGADRVEIGLGAEHREAAAGALRDVADGRAPQVTEHGVLLYSRDGPSAVPRVVTTLEAAGIAVGTVSTAGPTLDDVFLAKTGAHLEASTDEPAKAGA